MNWNIFQSCAQIWIDQWLNNSWEIDLKFTSDRLWLHLMANGLWSILRSILISFTTFHILSMVDVWKNVLVSFLRQTFTKGDIKYIFKSNVWKPTLNILDMFTKIYKNITNVICHSMSCVFNLYNDKAETKKCISSYSIQMKK